MKNVRLVLQPSTAAHWSQLQGAVVDDVVETAINGNFKEGKVEATSVNGHLRLSTIGNKLQLCSLASVIRSQVVHFRSAQARVGVVENDRVLLHSGRVKVGNLTGGGKGRPSDGHAKVDRRLQGMDVAGVGQRCRLGRLLNQLAPVQLVGSQIGPWLKTKLKSRQ